MAIIARSITLIMNAIPFLGLFEVLIIYFYTRWSSHSMLRLVSCDHAKGRMKEEGGRIDDFTVACLVVGCCILV